ncbi:XIAP-associated factor 1 [Salminus brasiliensis]|uniref:XIAP-associated factor 1 n=1 Tax=Salminus brasiliensis TaxID=930266 RepID=UPI003B82FCB4
MDDPVEAPEDLVQCSNCNKEVAKVNLPMHEVHCQRFLCLCPDCNEAVPKDQLNEHKVEQHTVVRCKKCDMKIQRYKLPDHETDECSERPQSCEFCELELPLSALAEHTVTCGSRTERCPDCRQYVTLKDRTKHAQICSSALSEDGNCNEFQSIYDTMTPEPADNLQDDQKFKNRHFIQGSSDPLSDSESENEEDDKHPGFTFSFQAHRKNKGGGAVKFGDLDQISTCPNCHLALPLQTLKWHENKCKIFKSLDLIN